MEVTIEIKDLDRSNESVLTNVALGVFDDPIDGPRAREFLGDPRHHLVVATEDGLVVGFASAVHYVHPDKAHSGLWVNEVRVASTHQGRGLGKALLQSLLGTGRRAGCTEAWVLTERANKAAMRLYSAVGGVEAPDAQVMFTFRLSPYDQRRIRNLGETTDETSRPASRPRSP